MIQGAGRGWQGGKSVAPRPARRPAPTYSRGRGGGHACRFLRRGWFGAESGSFIAAEWTCAQARAFCAAVRANRAAGAACSPATRGAAARPSQHPAGARVCYHTQPVWEMVQAQSGSRVFAAGRAERLMKGGAVSRAAACARGSGFRQAGERKRAPAHRFSGGATRGQRGAACAPGQRRGAPVERWSGSAQAAPARRASQQPRPPARPPAAPPRSPRHAHAPSPASSSPSAAGGRPHGSSIFCRNS